MVLQSTWHSYLDSRSRTKVKGFTLEFCVRSISPEPFGRFSLSFNQMFSQLDGVQNLCLVYVDSKSRSEFNVMWFTLQIAYTQYFLIPLHFIKMFLSVRLCAEPMTHLRKLKVTVTLQGHGIYPWILCPKKSLTNY